MEIKTREIRARVQSFRMGSHGLVGLDATGTERTTLPGHDFGAEEILQAIRVLEEQPRGPASARP